jgi:hypothetical protein
MAADTSGEVDHDRTPVYRDFVRALHHRRAVLRRHAARIGVRRAGAC